MHVTNLFPSMAIAFIATTALILALRPVAPKIGLVDHPAGRKFHQGIVPVVGGLAMFPAVYFGLLVMHVPPNILVGVFAASLLLVIVGVIDDKHALSAVARSPAQIAAVLLMVYGAGLVMTDMGNPFGMGVIETGRFSLLFTMLVTIATINAFNFIDGLDGLSASLALIAVLSIAVVAGLTNMYAGAALTVAAVILGYLVFNFPTSRNRSIRTFMGDTGSTLLGFSVVWIMIGVCQGADRVISPVHCLWFAALPIFDFFTCFVQRGLRGKSPFKPGHDHVHHILKRGGFTMRRRLSILAGFQIAYSSVGIAGHFSGVPDVVMFAAWSVLGISQAWIIRFIAKHNRVRGRRITATT